MKLRPITSTFLALAGAAALTQSLHAAETYTQGDLILGFTQAGNASDFVIDLGQASTFATATSAFNVSGLGNFSADLSSTFGSGYATDPTVEAGIFGATGLSASQGFTKDTLFESSALVAGISSTPTSNTASNQGSSQNQFQTFTGGFTSDSATANSSGAIETASSSTSFAAGNPPPGVTGAFKTGFDIDASPSVTNTLALYATEPNNSGGNGKSADLGTFTISGNTVTFTPEAIAAPEPSTYAMFLVGGLALAFAGRRVRRNS